MTQTATQKRRHANATWLVDVAAKNKRTSKLAKHWKMQADASDRRIEMRKGRSHHAE